MAYVSLNFLFRQRLFLLIALLFFQFDSTAQNLVPNPSFEEHDGCPSGLFQINKIKDWFPINGTPDYFHKCSTHKITLIPFNIEGFQNTQGAFDSAYIGEAIIPRDDSVREIIGVELTQSLQIGEKYFVTFYFSPENNIHS